jgi:predicted LPLAT superfamily acyltransferase
VAVLALREPRRNSRRYLTAVLGRPPSWREIWRHYHAFTMMHMLRLRVAGGDVHTCRPSAGCEEFTALMVSERPALLGSFHIGNSDLLGFFLGQFRRHVYMIRFRLGDPNFLTQLAAQCSAWVTFIWVNEKESLLFVLKQALDAGGTVAMKCDRISHSSKLEPFHFLGAQRWFPFTIYHLGLMFNRPVTFCVSVPSGPDASAIRGFPVFEPDRDSKESNLQRARLHFQHILTEIEALLRLNPYLWFNFTLLNPEVSPGVLSTVRPPPRADADAFVVSSKSNLY